MKKILFSSLIILVFQIELYAQDNSKVFIFNFLQKENTIVLSDCTEIPNQHGYNNQPAFISDDKILFSSENKGSTDIRKYNFQTKELIWLSKTEGGEYSPQAIPNSENIAAVRLDPDGLQRLYEYHIKNNSISTIIDEIAIAYFLFYNSNNILATVLNKNGMDLVKIDLSIEKVDTLASGAGRSISKIPKTNLMSYTLYNENNQLDLYTFDFETGSSVFICQLPGHVQDYIWLNDSQILAGSENQLFMYDTWSESKWTLSGTVEKFGISDITRIALSPDGKKIAIVGTKKP